MAEPRAIVLLFHADERPSRAHEYRLWHCIPHWQAAGHQVRMQFGLDEPLTDDVVVPQIDLSVLPDDYHRALAAHPCVVNREVTDISKTAFSRNLVSRQDSYAGPVIVKTNANYGGTPERRLIRHRGWPRRVTALAERGRRGVRRMLAAGTTARLAYTGRLDPNRYPIFPHKRDVPVGVFENPDLVVERFRPEHVGDRYYLRSYAFLGDQSITVRVASENPVVKGITGIDPELVPVDPSIVAERAALGFDYGKFDYVMHDGEAVLLDVNTTPSFGAVYGPELRATIATTLAPGIEQWLTAPR